MGTRFVSLQAALRSAIVTYVHWYTLQNVCLRRYPGAVRECHSMTA